MKKIAISVLSLAAVLLLTLSPALALANCDCCNATVLLRPGMLPQPPQVRQT